MNVLWIIILNTVLFVSSISGSHFRGGTISWKHVGSENRVEFKYKLAWRLGAENSASWKAYSTSSATVLYSGRYRQTANNSAEDWEEGEMTFRYNFTSKGPYRVSYSGGAWISLSSGGGNGGWNLETTVDLHHRVDTSRPNQSPQTSSRAIYRVQFDCDVIIQIPVIDADGDNVKCRWATSDEASSVAGILPGATLDEERCQISFTTNAVNNYVPGGWYAVAVTIEDFPKETLSINGDLFTHNTPMSRIPLQFLIRPEVMPGSCSDKPVFVQSTLPEGTMVEVEVGHTFTTSYYVHSVNELSRVDITGNTAIIQSSIQTDDQNRPDVYKVDIKWTPKEADKGTHIICATAEDINWKLSDTRCISVVAWVIDHCASSPCLHDGVCENRIVGFKCWCPDSWQGDICEYRLITKTEVCTDLEYTECTCRTSLQKRLVRKSYVIEFGAVGMVTGFMTTIAVYITWTLLNCQKSNKILNKKEALVNCNTDKSQDEEVQYKESEQIRGNRRNNEVIDILPRCQCFVDHTGYDHLQRRQKDDKHQYKIHQCSSKRPNLKISSVRFKV